MVGLGYTKQDVIKMTKTFPTIYSLSIENIKQKIDYLKEINLEEIITIDTKKLMQSVDLTYARFEFFKDIKSPISIDNYRKLFMGQKIFEKGYGVTKAVLLQKYNYQEYLEQKKKVV